MHPNAHVLSSHKQKALCRCSYTCTAHNNTKVIEKPTESYVQKQMNPHKNRLPNKSTNTPRKTLPVGASQPYTTNTTYSAYTTYRTHQKHKNRGTRPHREHLLLVHVMRACVRNRSLQHVLRRRHAAQRLLSACHYPPHKLLQLAVYALRHLLVALSGVSPSQCSHGVWDVQPLRHSLRL